MNRQVSDFHDTPENAAFVDQLDPERLRQIAEVAHERRALKREVIPTVFLCSNLSQCLGPTVEIRQRLIWIPAGYLREGRIVPWPLHVPKYAHPEGEDYQTRVEFYKVLLHEYAHFLLEPYSEGPRSLPRWMEEGSAVHVEVGDRRGSARERESWFLAYEGAVKFHILLPWDGMNQLRFLGPQRQNGQRVLRPVYAMAHFLTTTYGIHFWKQFIEAMSRERDHGNDATVFAGIYGFSWQEPEKNEKEYFVREVFKRNNT